MRKWALLIILFLIQLAKPLCASGDSLITKKNRFYLFSSYNVGVGAAKSNYVSKYSASDMIRYDFERHPNDFKTPSLGIGFFHQAKKSLFKIDISYVYTLKKIERSYTGSSRDIYDYVRSDYLDPRNVIYSQNLSQNYPVGGTFYKWNDNIDVNLNTHYLDIAAVVGRKISRSLSFIVGFRSNKMLSYSYNGKITRNADVKKITGFSAPGYIADTLIGTTVVVIDDPEELKRKMSQYISSNFYWSFGFNYKFLVNGNLFLLDLVYDLNAPPNSHKRRDYVCLKLSWCL